MARGKRTCRILKEIRRQIAEANDIEYVVEECQYKGDCKGTCPKCEAEVRYLESQLHKRQMLGKAVVVAGLSLGVIPVVAQEVSAVDTKVTTTVAAQSDGISGKYIISGNVCAKENLGKTSTLICASVKTTGGDNNPEKSVDSDRYGCFSIGVDSLPVEITVSYPGFDSLTFNVTEENYRDYFQVILVEGDIILGEVNSKRAYRHYKKEWKKAKKMNGESRVVVIPSIKK